MNVIFNDKIIYETENFVVCVPKTPHIPKKRWQTHLDKT